MEFPGVHPSNYNLASLDHRYNTRNRIGNRPRNHDVTLPSAFNICRELLANKMASICVVSSNCLNYPRQCFEGIVSFNQLEQRLYFTIVQKTHPIPPYKFCSSYTKNRNFLTAKILSKIITALIVRYSQVKNCLLLLVFRLPSAEVRLQSLGCYTKISIDSMETPYPPQFPGKHGWHAHI